MKFSTAYKTFGLAALLAFAAACEKDNPDNPIDPNQPTEKPNPDKENKVLKFSNIQELTLTAYSITDADIAKYNIILTPTANFVVDSAQFSLIDNFHLKSGVFINHDGAQISPVAANVDINKNRFQKLRGIDANNNPDGPNLGILADHKFRAKTAQDSIEVVNAGGNRNAIYVPKTDVQPPTPDNWTEVSFATLQNLSSAEIISLEMPDTVHIIFNIQGSGELQQKLNSGMTIRYANLAGKQVKLLNKYPSIIINGDIKMQCAFHVEHLKELIVSAANREYGLTLNIPTLNTVWVRDVALLPYPYLDVEDKPPRTREEMSIIFAELQDAFNRFKTLPGNSGLSLDVSNISMTNVPCPTDTIPFTKYIDAAHSRLMYNSATGKYKIENTPSTIAQMNKAPAIKSAPQHFATPERLLAQSQNFNNWRFTRQKVIRQRQYA